MGAQMRPMSGRRKGLLGAVALAVFAFFAFYTTTTQKSLLSNLFPQSAAAPLLTDEEIVDKCSKYVETVPAPVRAELQKEAAEAIDVLQKLGTHGVLKNASFVKAMSRFSLEERERIAWDAATLVLYIGEEVQALQESEEEAVMKAAPLPDIYKLNGLNVGVGGRPIHPALLGIDAHRGIPEGSEDQLPEAQKTSANTLLAWADSLPFKSDSVDFIVSLHNLEHLHDPVGTVLHYLDILKPGGGLGVVIPHWQYAWDARPSDHQWGHRWNTAPEVVCALYHRHWAHLATLEQLNTVPTRLSFDFVLRKKGKFVPFSQDMPSYKTGKDAYCDGTFIGPPNMKPVNIKC